MKTKRQKTAKVSGSIHWLALADWLNRQQMSREELARGLGKATGTINQWLYALRSPRPAFIREIARVLARDNTAMSDAIYRDLITSVPPLRIHRRKTV